MDGMGVVLCCSRGGRGPGGDRLKAEIATAEQRLAEAQTELSPKLESLDDEGSLRVQTIRSLVQGALLDLAACLAQATSTNSTTRSSRGLSLDEIVVANTPAMEDEGHGRNSSRSSSGSSSISHRNATAISQGDEIVIEGDTEVRIHFKQERETNV